MPNCSNSIVRIQYCSSCWLQHELIAHAFVKAGSIDRERESCPVDNILWILAGHGVTKELNHFASSFAYGNTNKRRGER
jgi:hypothetical protein